MQVDTGGPRAGGWLTTLNMGAGAGNPIVGTRQQQSWGAWANAFVTRSWNAILGAPGKVTGGLSQGITSGLNKPLMIIAVGLVAVAAVVLIIRPKIRVG
jgi:hypothetical protein